MAWKAFEDVSMGILAKDDTLNSLLIHVFSSETSEFEEIKNGETIVPKFKIHTLVEYYFKVILFELKSDLNYRLC